MKPANEREMQVYGGIAANYFKDTKTQQPQAQKEPEVVLTVVKENDYWSGGHFHEGKKPTIHSWDVRNIPIGTQLITLQSHREALAQHRAALEECVRQLVWEVGSERQLWDEKTAAAITHANQVLEGGGK